MHGVGRRQCRLLRPQSRLSGAAAAAAIARVASGTNCIRHPGSHRAEICGRTQDQSLPAGPAMQQQNPEHAAALRLAASGNDFQVLHEIVAKARQNLSQNDWDYIVGGAESETTLRRNRMALDTIAFRPRVLRDVSRVDPSLEVLGRTLRLPVVLAPVGSLESFHPVGAESVVRAVDAFGAAQMLSSVCDPGLEDLAAAAPDALRLFQLYVRGDEAWVDDHVERAIAHGYAAFCLTVDTAHYSRRERDIAKRFVTAGRRRVQGRAFQAALDWRTVKRIKSR